MNGQVPAHMTEIVCLYRIDKTFAFEANPEI